MKKTYFTRIEALEEIREYLKTELDNECNLGYVDDLHNNVFNVDYYIIGYNKSEQALNQYGIFSALETIMEFEEASFGMIKTNMGNPEEVANMLWYVLTYNWLNESDIFTIIDDYNDEITKECALELIEYLDYEIEELNKLSDYIDNITQK